MDENTQHPVWYVLYDDDNNVLPRIEGFNNTTAAERFMGGQKIRERNPRIRKWMLPVNRDA